MNINEEFKEITIDKDKLLSYGFIKKDSFFIYQKEDKKNHILITLTIEDNNYDILIWDTDFNEEAIGSISNPAIKESWLNLIEDIKKNCGIKSIYFSRQARLINDFIKNKYQVEPEFLFTDYPNFGVYRNLDNKKWFALIMPLNYETLKIKKAGKVEILNVKTANVESLLKIPGFNLAYHMNKKNWITLLLNDTIKDEEILECLSKSYDDINLKKKK